MRLHGSVHNEFGEHKNKRKLSKHFQNCYWDAIEKKKKKEIPSSVILCFGVTV